MFSKLICLTTVGFAAQASVQIHPDLDNPSELAEANVFSLQLLAGSVQPGNWQAKKAEHVWRGAQSIDADNLALVGAFTSGVQKFNTQQAAKVSKSLADIQSHAFKLGLNERHLSALAVERECPQEAKLLSESVKVLQDAFQDVWYIQDRSASFVRDPEAWLNKLCSGPVTCEDALDNLISISTDKAGDCNLFQLSYEGAKESWRYFNFYKGDQDSTMGLQGFLLEFINMGVIVQSTLVSIQSTEADAYKAVQEKYGKTFAALQGALESSYLTCEGGLIVNVEENIKTMGAQLKARIQKIEASNIWNMASAMQSFQDTNIITHAASALDVSGNFYYNSEGAIQVREVGEGSAAYVVYMETQYDSYDLVSLQNQFIEQYVQESHDDPSVMAQKILKSGCYQGILIIESGNGIDYNFGAYHRLFKDIKSDEKSWDVMFWSQLHRSCLAPIAEPASGLFLSE